MAHPVRPVYDLSSVSDRLLERVKQGRAQREAEEEEDDDDALYRGGGEVVEGNEEEDDLDPTRLRGSASAEPLHAATAPAPARAEQRRALTPTHSRGPRRPGVRAYSPRPVRRRGGRRVSGSLSEGSTGISDEDSASDSESQPDSHHDSGSRGGSGSESGSERSRSGGTSSSASCSSSCSSSPRRGAAGGGRLREAHGRHPSGPGGFPGAWPEWPGGGAGSAYPYQHQPYYPYYQGVPQPGYPFYAPYGGAAYPPPYGAWPGVPLAARAVAPWVGPADAPPALSSPAADPNAGPGRSPSLRVDVAAAESDLPAGPASPGSAAASVPQVRNALSSLEHLRSLVVGAGGGRGRGGGGDVEAGRRPDSDAPRAAEPLASTPLAGRASGSAAAALRVPGVASADMAEHDEALAEALRNLRRESRERPSMTFDEAVAHVKDLQREVNAGWDLVHVEEQKGSSSRDLWYFAGLVSSVRVKEYELVLFHYNLLHCESGEYGYGNFFTSFFEPLLADEEGPHTQVLAEMLRTLPDAEQVLTPDLPLLPSRAGPERVRAAKASPRPVWRENVSVLRTPRNDAAAGSLPPPPPPPPPPPRPQSPARAYYGPGSLAEVAAPAWWTASTAPWPAYPAPYCYPWIGVPHPVALPMPVPMPMPLPGPPSGLPHLPLPQAPSPTGLHAGATQPAGRRPEVHANRGLPARTPTREELRSFSWDSSSRSQGSSRSDAEDGSRSRSQRGGDDDVDYDQEEEEEDDDEEEDEDEEDGRDDAGDEKADLGADSVADTGPCAGNATAAPAPSASDTMAERLRLRAEEVEALHRRLASSAVESNAELRARPQRQRVIDYLYGTMAHVTRTIHERDEVLDVLARQAGVGAARSYGASSAAGASGSRGSAGGGGGGGGGDASGEAAPSAAFESNEGSAGAAAGGWPRPRRPRSGLEASVGGSAGSSAAADDEPADSLAGGRAANPEVLQLSRITGTNDAARLAERRRDTVALVWCFVVVWFALAWMSSVVNDVLECRDPDRPIGRFGVVDALQYHIGCPTKLEASRYSLV